MQWVVDMEIRPNRKLVFALKLQNGVIVDVKGGIAWHESILHYVESMWQNGQIRLTGVNIPFDNFVWLFQALLHNT